MLVGWWHLFVVDVQIVWLQNKADFEGQAGFRSVSRPCTVVEGNHDDKNKRLV